MFNFIKVDLREQTQAQERKTGTLPSILHNQAPSYQFALCPSERQCVTVLKPQESYFMCEDVFVFQEISSWKPKLPGLLRAGLPSDPEGNHWYLCGLGCILPSSELKQYSPAFEALCLLSKSHVPPVLELNLTNTYTC